MEVILDPSIQISRRIISETTQRRTTPDYAFFVLYSNIRANYVKYEVTYTDENAEIYRMSFSSLGGALNRAGDSRCAIITVEVTSNKPFVLINTVNSEGQTNTYPAGTSIITVLVAELGTARHYFVLTP